MVGFEGSRLDRPTREALIRLAPGGIVLFRRNLDSPEHLAELIADLRKILPYPTLCALDQEGGRVSRLEPWIGATPTAARLGDAGEAAVHRFARATGAALSALGFNVDFAPVVDLCAPGIDNAIGDRSFGTDPTAVTRLAGAFLDGLTEGGVPGCLKHFPGLGRAMFDSHVRRPTIERSLPEMEAEDLLPFRSLAPRAEMVMVGHAHYSAVDPAGDIPASLSRNVIQGLLRGRLAYGGLVLSDDLEMGALDGFADQGRDAVRALEAGCDLLLYCRDLERAARSRDALLRRAEADPAFAGRLDVAAGAVARLASRIRTRAPDMALWEEARRAIAAASALA